MQLTTICVYNDYSCIIIPDRVSLRADRSPVAGDSYSLECSAGGYAAMFQWLGPPDGRTPVVNGGMDTIIIISNSSTSQLQFRPLQQSHNGSYSCRAVTNADVLLSQPIEIHAKGSFITLA